MNFREYEVEKAVSSDMKRETYQDIYQEMYDSSSDIYVKIIFATRQELYKEIPSIMNMISNPRMDMEEYEKRITVQSNSR